MSSARAGIGHRLIERLEFVMEGAERGRCRRSPHRGRFGRTSPRRPGGSSRSSVRFGTETSPSSGVSSPTIIRKSVVLPAPFGPTSPIFFAGIELEGRVDEQHLSSVLLVDAGERDHPTIVGWQMANGKWQMVWEMGDGRWAMGRWAMGRWAMGDAPRVSGGRPSLSARIFERTADGG